MCVGTNTCQLKANKHKSKNAWNRFVRSWDSETRQHIWTMLIYDFYVMHVYKRWWHEECRQHSTFNQTCVTQLVFAVQPFESFEALLMPVLWHHDCINLDAHTIPLAKTVGRSVCYSVARKSGHVGMIFTSKKKHDLSSHLTWSLFGFQEIIFLLAPPSCCMMWKYGTCKFPPPWTFLNSRSFRPRRSEADSRHASWLWVGASLPPKKWIKLEIMRHPPIMSWIGLGFPFKNVAPCVWAEPHQRSLPQWRP